MAGESPKEQALHRQNYADYMAGIREAIAGLKPFELF